MIIPEWPSWIRTTNGMYTKVSSYLLKRESLELTQIGEIIYGIETGTDHRDNCYVVTLFRYEILAPPFVVAGVSLNRREFVAVGPRAIRYIHHLKEEGLLTYAMLSVL